MEPKDACSCESRLSYRQKALLAWAPAIVVIIECVTQLVR